MRLGYVCTGNTLLRLSYVSKKRRRDVALLQAMSYSRRDVDNSGTVQRVDGWSESSNPQENRTFFSF
jgi:hypothetical protein